MSTLSGPSSNSSGTGTGTNTILPTNALESTRGGGSNAGAIAGAIGGGIAGGLVGLGLIAAFVIWFVMKKYIKTAPSSASNNDHPPPDNYVRYGHPPVFLGPPNPSQMVYNPSDPSTFPPALHGPSPGGGTPAYPRILYDPHVQRGQYIGVPEV